MNSSILDFSNSITNQTEELGGNLHFAGGQLKSYDGNVLVEENFNYPPAALIKVNGTTGGTVFPNDVSLDNYWYWKAIYNFKAIPQAHWGKCRDYRNQWFEKNRFAH